MHTGPARLPAGGPDTAQTAPEPPQTGEPGSVRVDDRSNPETALWAALAGAGTDGATVGDLMAACGMSRSWVYYRLREHATAGRAAQTARGAWQAVPPPSDGPGDGRPRPAPTRPGGPVRPRAGAVAGPAVVAVRDRSSRPRVSRARLHA